MNSLPDHVTRALADPLAAGRSRASAGQKVIGMASSDVPVELIVAAGAFPLALPYEPRPTPQADLYLEATFSPAARSLTEQWLAGNFDFMDAVVFPRSNDSLQRAYYYLCELQRRNLARGPRPLLFDVAKIPRHTSIAHTREATRRLCDDLATDLQALPEAISLRNHRRGLMRAVLERRRTDNAPNGPLAERIARAADFCDASSFDAALETWLALSSPVWRGPRWLLAGSAPPDDRWHLAAEAAGARIVDEFGDHAGDRWGAPVASNGTALEAIADHQTTLRAGSRSFEDRATALVERARAARVDAVVLWIIEEDEAIVWDVPAMKRSLKQANIPLLELTRRAWNEDAASALAPMGTMLGRKP
jgi:benzoyl-CoA reductase/2-hydroxyglutaryl-CoA dehydratase subunit BcrC/BadD/HgdB